jgi:Ca-activated chloride channel family protein
VPDDLTGRRLLRDALWLVAAAVPTAIGVSVLLLALGLAAAAARAAPAGDGGDLPGGLYLAGASGGHPAPALDTRIDVRVSGLLARVAVVQRYQNAAEEWAEGVYVFPLPADAAVDRLVMRVGDRVIEGEVREREAARQTYEQARAAGRRAALVEQDRPNLFRASVANIPPWGQVEIRMEYQHLLRYDSDEVALRVPLVVGPRFIPGAPVDASVPAARRAAGWSADTTEVPDASRITPPVADPTAGAINPIHIAVELDAGFALDGVDSASHDVVVAPGGAARRFRIAPAAGSIPADRDFLLRWRALPGAAPTAAAFRESAGGEEYVLLMLMPPREAVLASERVAREVIFVIDTSGSMHGTSIAQAREALQLAVERLSPNDRFNVIRFNDRSSALFPAARWATQNNVAQALGWIAGLEAAGGTVMAPALELALQNAEPGYLRQVVFLTDGAVGNEDALLRLIGERLDTNRLFTIGIGSAPNGHFMRKAAEWGRGEHLFIASTDEVAERVGVLLRKLEMPALTDVAVDWPAASEAEVWPGRIPDLYAGAPLLIAARLARLPQRLRVRGASAGHVWTADVALAGAAEQAPGVARAWARRKIDALMDRSRVEGETAELRRAIVDTALAHRLLSRYTAMVAVDRTPARPEGAPMDTSAMPTNLPHGWSMARVFGALPRTVTDAPAHLLRGGLLLALLGLLLLAARERRPC